MLVLGAFVESFCDSIFDLPARPDRAGHHSGARGDLYFAEPLPPPPGFQHGAVAVSGSVQGGRREDSSLATAAAFFSEIGRAHI